MTSLVANSVAGLPRPRVRLRYVLAGLCAAFVGTWIVPRGRAAWRLHDTAARYADYGLCMAGPTGASLLRDQPTEFWRLVRRRVVASAPDETPFAGCSPIVATLTGSSRAVDLHRSRARDIAEWGRAGADRGLSDFAQSLPDLTALANEAWPFLKNGVSVLVKPSLGAKEAIHPVAVARPGTFSGMRLHGSLFRARRINEKGWFTVLSDAEGVHAFRSRDHGHHWTATSAWQTSLEDTHERCSADGSRRAFGLDLRRASATIAYFDGELRTGQTAVGEGLRVLSLACDEVAAVVAAESRGQVKLLSCPVDQPCKSMPIPPLLGDTRADGLDVARLHGATVIAVTEGALVRVVSTRDDGRAYTPFTVAMDHQDNPLVADASLWPAQLLALGNNLFLTQDTKTGPSQTAVVVSNDFGASWRTFQ